jgi:hypothetical protein
MPWPEIRIPVTTQTPIPTTDAGNYEVPLRKTIIIDNNHTATPAGGNKWLIQSMAASHTNAFTDTVFIKDADGNVIFASTIPAANVAGTYGLDLLGSFPVVYTGDSLSFLGTATSTAWIRVLELKQ